MPVMPKLPKRRGVRLCGEEGGREKEGGRDLRSEVAAVFLVDLSGIVFGHEADSAGIHVQSVDVVLSEETDAKTGIL